MKKFNWYANVCWWSLIHPSAWHKIVRQKSWVQLIVFDVVNARPKHIHKKQGSTICAFTLYTKASLYHIEETPLKRNMLQMQREHDMQTHWILWLGAVSSSRLGEKTTETLWELRMLNAYTPPSPLQSKKIKNLIYEWILAPNS